MAAFRNSASDAGSHPILAEYQSDLHRFAYQAAIRVKEDRQVVLRQDGQELPEPLGGTLIKSAFPSDPLGATSPAGVWLTRGNDKNHWLASELCEYARRTPHKFANHNSASC